MTSTPLRSKMSSGQAPAIIQDAFHRKNYKTNNVLGKGGFAVVYHVTDLYSSENFACKLTQKSRLTKKKFFEKFTSEIKIHRQLINQYIVRVNNVFKDSINYYMLMELCNGGTLSDLVRRRQKGLTEEETQRVAWELCQGYLYLKQHKIVHRDMKSSNVFLTVLPCPELEQANEKALQCLQCKIGDFGLSVQLEDDAEKHFTLCGTPNFLPPETIVSHVFRRLKINRECDQNIDQECQELCKSLVHKLENSGQKLPSYSPIESGHSYPSDMWSLGCIIYSLLYLRPPFESNNIQNTYKKIIKGEYAINHKLNPNVSQYAIDFIQKLLIIDPNDRMTIESAFQHPWIQEGNAVKLKHLPLSCRDPDFTDARWSSHEMAPFLAYQETIAQRIQLIKEGKVQLVKQENVENLVEKHSNTTDNHFLDVLGKHFQSFFFLVTPIKLPDPVTFTPVFQYLDLKQFQISPASLIQAFDAIRGERQTIVFNEYDLWLYLQQAASNNANSSGPIQHPLILHNYTFTLSWIDFSNRYGFAYQLSNGSVGVLFNDMSIIVLSANLKYIDYIDVFNFDSYTRNADQLKMDEKMPPSHERQQIILRMKFQYAKEFISEKKYKLIMYFKEYLENRSIQPIMSDKRETVDIFVNQHFDYFYSESSRVYGQNVTEDQVLQAYDERMQNASQVVESQKIFNALPQQNLPYAVKMMSAAIEKDYVALTCRNYIRQIETDCQAATPFTQSQMSQILNVKITQILTFPQLYIKRYNLNEQSGTLCILYNSKVFQVNYPDHIKIVIAHKTVSFLNNRRELMVFPSCYLKEPDFKLDELRSRIAEARRLYELVRRSRE